MRTILSDRVQFVISRNDQNLIYKVFKLILGRGFERFLSANQTEHGCLVLELLQGGTFLRV